MSKQVQFIRRRVAILTVFVVTVGVQAGRAHAADWPQFRGTNRDGKSPETGLLKQWPAGGPRLIRTIRGFGHRYSSPVIVQGRIYITGKVKDDLKILCFDLSGNKIWETTHGRAYDGETAPHSPCPGVRSTPTVHEDMLFLLGCLGKLAAYRISDGKQIWSMDLVADLGGRIPPWGYAESVLVDGDKVICTPGS